MVDSTRRGQVLLDLDTLTDLLALPDDVHIVGCGWSDEHQCLRITLGSERFASVIPLTTTPIVALYTYRLRLEHSDSPEPPMVIEPQLSWRIDAGILEL